MFAQRKEFPPMLRKTDRKFSIPSLKILLLVASIVLIASAPAAAFPDILPLPNGFQPEGIAIGDGPAFYVGSIPTGAVYRGDLRTGEGEVLVPGQAGHQAIGLKVDERTRLLYVAGGPTGSAFVYDADTGSNVAAIPLNDGTNTFINDVVVTGRAVYFTDSFRANYYRIALGKGGRLPDSPVAEAIPLSGDYQHVDGEFNSNGIAATPNGQTLILVNSAQASLYRVEPLTGAAALIDLGGSSVQNGDGLLLIGKTLYVVQNFLNQIAIVELDASLASGIVSGAITNPNFDIPTTIASFGNTLYAVNSRFSTPPTPDTEYQVIKVTR
jgi:sugar lactone lactonase YvrE